MSTGRLIIDGLAVIRSSAFASFRSRVSDSGSRRNVVPARLQSRSHPTSRAHRANSARSMPEAA